MNVFLTVVHVQPCTKSRQQELSGSISFGKPYTIARQKHLHRKRIFFKRVRANCLTFKSATIGWRADDGVPSRKREIVTIGDVHSAYLVPGGRRSLGFYSDGRIGYYDLDFKGEITEKQLVPAQSPKSILTIRGILATLPMTSFNLAMYLRAHLDDDETYTCITIWKIDFVLGGQDVTGLKVTYLKSILMDRETCWN